MASLIVSLDATNGEAERFLMKPGAVVEHETQKLHVA